MKFLVVVPTLDSGRFIHQTLASLLELQAGDFDLRVHVQDGGSGDETLAVVERWRQRIASGEIPDAPRRRLTVASARDAGLYDAVAGVLENHDLGDEDVMTWLGSDDLLLPGALATAGAAFRRFPEIRWLCGQPMVADEAGVIHTGWRIPGFAQRDVRRGLHDGRSLPFIMQEGTLWRASLYREAGGLRRDLRLAGDFDLWRRFARSDALVTASFPLAIWRQRPGQASGDRDAYYAEVDRVLAQGGLPRLDDEVASDAPSARFQPLLLERYPGADFVLRSEGVAFQPLDGFGGVEGSAPAHGLHASFVRMAGATARVRLPILEGGVPYRVAIRLRNPHPGQRLVVRVGASTVFDESLDGRDANASQVVAFTCTSPHREPVMSLECRGVAPGRPHGTLGRLLGRGSGATLAAGELLVEDIAFCRAMTS